MTIYLPLKWQAFDQTYFSNKRLENKTLDFEADVEASIVLQKLIKIINIPERQTKIIPQQTASVLGYKVGDLFSHLHYLYTHFDIRHFFGPEKYIPNIDDPFWRVTTYEHYYKRIGRRRAKGRKLLSVKQRGAIHTKYNNTCVYCGDISKEVDHIVPISRGGTNELSNLVASCTHCNRVKSDRTLLELGWSMMYE